MLKGYFVLLDGEKSSFLVNVHRSQYVKQLIDVNESNDLSKFLVHSLVKISLNPAH